MKNHYWFGLIIVLAIGILFWIRPQYSLLKISPDYTIQLEIAKTRHEREKGLMFRKNLSKHQGMLFIFPDEKGQAFWMKNTLISLDILWVDREKKIVYYFDEVPPCYTATCPLYEPPSSIQAPYVIEIQAGLRKKLKLNMGTILNF